MGAGLVPELVRTDPEERALGPHFDRGRPERATGRPCRVDNPDRWREVGDDRRVVPMLHLDPGRGGLCAEGAEPGDVLLDHVPLQTIPARWHVPVDDRGQCDRVTGCHGVRQPGACPVPRRRCPPQLVRPSGSSGVRGCRPDAASRAARCCAP